MKTYIPKRIYSVDQATSFINTLLDNQELWHFEDDVDDIIFETEPTRYEKLAMESAVRQMFNLEDFDVMAVCCDLLYERQNNSLK